jgi:hypothetical protein
MDFRIGSWRFRDRFEVHAAQVWRFLTSYELLVAHNAAFDFRFINREMTAAGLSSLARPIYCTMKGYRALGLGGSASLNAVCSQIKLARAGDLHDAIEDAWLAMQIYLWLHGGGAMNKGIRRHARIRQKGTARSPSEAGYQVGYGKPPQEHRFRPGQCGNRKGRPKEAPRITCQCSEPHWQLTTRSTSPNELNATLMPHNINHGDACFAYFNKTRGIPPNCVSDSNRRIRPRAI